ncbi:hydrolase [Virgibacillus phasianinus]|uniref:Hydrolase n=2 Tax=Virgibacillus phasianinus TaxID=2017483 RepID=A0A220U8R4_9BACI|nr:hydrolase [Virgibacillus phasianinus]
MPTIALGSEAVYPPNHAANQLLTKQEGANSLGFNLLNNIRKNSINPSGNGQVIDTDRFKNRFIQNAIQLIQDMHAGNYHHALKLTSSDFKKRITEQWLEMYRSTYIQQINSGSFIGFSSAKVKGSNQVHTNVELGLKFEQATVPMIIRLDPSGNVDDILATVQKGEVAGDPLYSNPDTFTEKEVVVGKGTFALPGTLSIPKGEGPFPAVVLVQGSGASDRDERAYALKPFRDLAHGLASKGIAVLRYNKRTFEHTLKTTADPNHTVDKETTDDAVLASNLLEQQKRIDNDQIFILGHSQGGMMVPQIINKDKRDNIEGAIVMAGPARTIQDVVLDQLDYLFSIDRMPLELYEFLKGQYELLNDPDFSGENPPAGFQLGQSMFWDSINDIKAAEMASEQTKPLLIIQGEEDYQVQADSEIPIWRRELSHRNNVEYQLYPKLNHFFTEGEEGMSTPEEYLIPANIPEYVIRDIAAWVKSNPHQLNSASEMKALVDRFEAEGEFTNHGAARALKVHLSAVNRFEEQGFAEKVVKHMKGFRLLLNHQKKTDLISLKAYNALKVDADQLIKKWE